ncbi:MAG: carboxylesterase family protein, partial [Muribaculaceae bacterium]|nr:carboxylesterase family protein [Muribaculaceae bacterium]
MRQLILAIGMLTALYATAREFVTTGGIPYRDNNFHERCALDIYHPASPADSTAALPVVVWFHGGSLTGGFRHFPDGMLDGKY